MTGRDLVTASLRLIGAVAPGESVAASEATDGLSALNRMLGGWSTEGLLIHAQTQDTLTLVPGTATYTMGTGGTFNTARPQQILQAVLRTSSGSSATDYPLDLLTLDQWSAITQKSLEGSHPRSLYDDGAYPLRSLTVYPKPTAAHTLVIFSLKALSEVSTLDSSISLPPGYDRALIYNLALELSPEYGKSVPDAVAMVATESKAGLKRMNLKPSYLRADDALVGNGGFNIYTGGY